MAVTSTAAASSTTSSAKRTGAAETAVARVELVAVGGDVELLAVLLEKRRLVQLHLLHTLLVELGLIVTFGGGGGGGVAVCDGGRGVLHVVLYDALHALLFEAVAHVVERVLIGRRVEHRVDEYHRVQDEL